MFLNSAKFKTAEFGENESKKEENG